MFSHPELVVTCVVLQRWQVDHQVHVDAADADELGHAAVALFAEAREAAIARGLGAGALELERGEARAEQLLPRVVVVVPRPAQLARLEHRREHLWSVCAWAVSCAQQHRRAVQRASRVRGAPDAYCSYPSSLAIHTWKYEAIAFEMLSLVTE